MYNCSVSSVYILMLNRSIFYFKIIKLSIQICYFKLYKTTGVAIFSRNKLDFSLCKLKVSFIINNTLITKLKVIQ